MEKVKEHFDGTAECDEEIGDLNDFVEDFAVIVLENIDNNTRYVTKKGDDGDTENHGTNLIFFPDSGILESIENSNHKNDEGGVGYYMYNQQVSPIHIKFDVDRISS